VAASAAGISQRLRRSRTKTARGFRSERVESLPEQRVGLGPEQRNAEDPERSCRMALAPVHLAGLLPEREVLSREEKGHECQRDHSGGSEGHGRHEGVRVSEERSCGGVSRPGRRVRAGSGPLEAGEALHGLQRLDGVEHALGAGRPESEERREETRRGERRGQDPRAGVRSRPRGGALRHSEDPARAHPKREERSAVRLRSGLGAAAAATATTGSASSSAGAALAPTVVRSCLARTRPRGTGSEKSAGSSSERNRLETAVVRDRARAGSPSR
jgi:hypothetical protein